MFSYFQKGITGTTPTKIIDLPQLIKQIKNNPEKPLLDWIRVLRKQGNDEYNKLKEGIAIKTSKTAGIIVQIISSKLPWLNFNGIGFAVLEKNLILNNKI